MKAEKHIYKYLLSKVSSGNFVSQGNVQNNEIVNLVTP